MRYTRRILVGTLAPLVAVSLMAACGSDSASSTDSTIVSAATDSVPTDVGGSQPSTSALAATETSPTPSTDTPNSATEATDGGAATTAEPADGTPTSAAGLGSTTPTTATTSGATHSSSVTTTSVATGTKSSTPTVTTAKPATTTPPKVTTTTAKATTTTAAAGSRSFTVDAAGSAPTFSVARGTDVSLTVNSATDQEFHLHGYDITLSGTHVRFLFTADTAGTYILESHDTGKLICTLVVS